jgi:hypothetical protein
MKLKTIAALTLTALTLAACSNGAADVTRNDQQNATTQLARYQKNQPVPQFDWSQYRQTLIDVESAQVHGMATTSFFFTGNGTAPIKVCPSIGFALASTAQLTNPQQGIYSSTQGSITLPQVENNGVFTGDSTGTYVVCVADSGVKYVVYWEGDVETEGGPAHWSDKEQRIVLDGAPTVVAKSK